MSDNTEDDIETLQDEEEILSLSEHEVTLISTPELSENSTVPEDIAVLSYSFGYNCKKLYNLVLIDDEVLVFASGNLINFFNISTREITTRRSSDAGIGSIIKNPSENYPNHLTIAENGKKANIYIYKYPEMELVSLLRKGSTCQYTLVDYTADGELLGSQGGYPDYTITIWDWKRQIIKLRAKSFSNDVLNIFFSPWIPEQLTTSGLGHIKFWRLADTFTGLKLQGVPGRFGKTEICNILGIYSMPDEKVLSGCEWGNILVWDEGLIKFEVCRKNRKPCHQGQITQIFVNGEEVTTVGTDGFIRVWFWETVELADPPEDDRFVEIEPIHEYRVGDEKSNAEILKTVNGSAGWFAQDGNGGIWSFSLSYDSKSKPPEQIFRCHSGEIVGLGVSPISTHIATFGDDGRLHVYDYIKKKMIFHHQFIAAGRDIVWAPVKVDSSGIVLILGFDDGVTRITTVNLQAKSESSVDNIQLIQAIKCHHKPITKLSVNPAGTILVSGSEDCTLFIHKITKESPYIKLTPIGFLKVPDAVTCINWHPKESLTVIVGCQHGQVCEATLPNAPTPVPRTTYHLEDVTVRNFQFVSKKSQIKRDNKLREIEAKRVQTVKDRKEKYEKMKSEDPLLATTESEFLASFGEDEEEILEPLYIPKEGSPVLWIQYTSEGNFWLSMGDYDCGYVYEYSFDHAGPISCTPIPDADHIEINSFAVQENYQIFGMGDGSLRIVRRKKDWRDLTDFWKLHMHDIFNGKITAIKFSHDRKFFFSVGADGNIFAYNWNVPTKDVAPISLKAMERLRKPVEDIKDPDHKSLEQQKEKENVDRMQKIANDNKNEVLRILAVYKKEFEEIMKKNMTLPESQRLKPDELILDDRITNDLQEKLNSEMELIREKHAFEFEKTQLAGKKLMEYFIEPLQEYPIEVVGIRNQQRVYSFRIKKLDDEYYFSKDDLKERIRQEYEKRKMQDVPDMSLRSCESDTSIQNVESFLNGLSPSTIENKLESKMRRLLSKYRERKSKESSRKKEWEKVNCEKPNPDVNHPDDVKAIEEAQETIGDYKLKSDPVYDPPDEQRDSTLKKYMELLIVREEIFNIRNDYNKRVFALRDKKCQLIKYIEKKTKKLEAIHSEIPVEERKFCNIKVEVVPEREFPEQNFMLDTYYGKQGEVSEVDGSEKSKKQMLLEEDDVKHLLELQRRVLGINPQQNALEYRSPGAVQVQVDEKLKEKIDKNNEKVCDWELELKDLRLKRKLFEQSQILEKINTRIEEYDQELEKLAEDRYEIEVQAKFKELYLLTLNQELWVLKDFEFLEDKMIEDVDNKMMERRQFNFKMNQTKNDLEMYRKSIEDLETSAKAIEQRFLDQLTESKFSGFLKKIFKKKLPKQTNSRRESRVESRVKSERPDDDADKVSSESEDSSSSDEDEDVTLKYLDEGICPKGCDQKQYEMAFSLRAERHEIERSIREKEANVQRCNQEIQLITSSIIEAEQDLELRKGKLLEFRREKQKALNVVDTLVMLKMDQMQYFKNQEEFEDIDNTLLFNSSNLSKLYARVGQLALETIEVKRKHRINVIHLAKMKTDIKYMEKQISDLKDETNQAILKKFGRIINLDDLEETILRRFTYDMRANINDIKKEYLHKITEIKKIIAKKQEEYNRVIQEGTEKLNILTVLEEEKNYLRRIIMQQQKAKDKTSDYKRDVGRDLDKLKEICKHQKDQIEMLQREIRALSLKSKPFASLSQDLQNSVAQLGQDKCFEESLSSHAQDSMLSSVRTTPDKEIRMEISNLISKFLDENFKEEIPETELILIGDSLTKYLTDVATNFDPNSMDDVLPKVVEEFKKLMPPGFELFVQPAKIAILFQNIVKNFNSIESDVNPGIILKEIVSNIMESQIFFDLTFSQDLITELLKQMIVTMKIEDLVSTDCMSEMTKMLKELEKFDVKQVNVEEVLNNVSEIIAIENLEDEIDEETISDVLNKIVTNLRE